MTSSTITADKKPRITNLLLLNIIYIISAGSMANSWLRVVGDYRTYGLDVPLGKMLIAYGSIVIVILSFIVLVLLTRRMRLGLILTALVAIGIILTYGQEVLTGFASSLRMGFVLGVIVIAVLGLVYSYLYLFRQPIKSAFH